MRTTTPALARAAAAIAVSCCAFCLCLPVGAQRTRPARAAAPAPSAEETEALELFERSVQEYRAGNFQSAADLLRRAYALHAEPTLLYNLARALEGLGDEEGAVDSYTRYLDGAPNAADRGAIEQKITTLRRQIAEREALARAAREPAEPPPRPEPVGPAPSTASGRGPWPWLVSGVGLAGLAAGGTFAVLALSKNASADDASAQTEVWSRYEGARDLATVANVCFVAGGVILAGGVLWVLLSCGGHAAADGADEGDRDGEGDDVALVWSRHGVGLEW